MIFNTLVFIKVKSFPFKDIAFTHRNESSMMMKEKCM